MKTSFIFVRHGQSMANIRHIIAGVYNAPLSRLGFKQAKATAKYLKREKIDAIYSSPIARASCTAQIVADERGQKVRYDKGFEELHFGVYEGKSVLLVRDDPVWQSYTDRFADAVFPQGEATAQAGKRFAEACVRVAAAHPDQTVLVVSHSIVFALFLYAAAGVDGEKKSLVTPNASVTRIDYEDGKFTLKSFGENAHLQAVNERSKTFKPEVLR